MCLLGDKTVALTQKRPSKQLKWYGRRRIENVRQSKT